MRNSSSCSTKKNWRRIDDWRFENRMPTRAAAIRELLRRGLASEKHFEPPATDDAGTRVFGVLEDTSEEKGQNK